MTLKESPLSGFEEDATRRTDPASAERLPREGAPSRIPSARFEAILECLGVGVTVQDREGRLIFANRAAAEVTGYAAAEDLLRTPSSEVLRKFELFDEHGAPFDVAQLPGRLVLAGAQSAQTVLRFVERGSGRQRWATIYATPVHGDDGAPELTVNVWHDVTESRRREEAERYVARVAASLSEPLDCEVRLQALAKSLVPGLADWCVIYLLDDGRLRQAVVAHVDPARVEGARDYAEKHPPQRGQAIWRVIETGRSELYPALDDDRLRSEARSAEHLEALRRSGMESLLIVPVRAQERIGGALALVSAGSGRHYDALDLALAEEIGRRAGAVIENARLYEAERRMRASLEVVARAGECFAQTLDYERTLDNTVATVLPVLADFAFFDIVEGGEVRRIAAAHDDPRVDRIIKASRWVRSARHDLNLCALSSGETGFHPQIDEAFRRDIASGPEHLEVLNSLALSSMITVPLKVEGQLLGALTLCYGKSGRHHGAVDVHTAEELARRAAVAVLQARLYADARKSAEAAAAAAHAAQEASTLKEEFLATVSHELRTPLNAILGWAALLRKSPEGPALSKGLEVIFRNGQAQAKLIDDILDVSRIITGKLRLELEPTEVSTIVLEAIEVVRPSFEAKRIDIDVELGGPPRAVVADKSRLKQVVWNLLSNAAKFTPPDGQVRVKLGYAAGELKLSVQDTGCGIDAAFLLFVFDRFKQADATTTRQVGGLGLGLAIVRQIVELHGGSAFAYSAGLGRGTTFTIRLPVSARVPLLRRPPPGVTAASRHDVEWSTQPTLLGRRVLLVEDDADSRELLRTVVEAAGGQVQAADSVARALAIFATFRPELIITDIGMPDEDGCSLIGKLRAAGETLPIIALTAYTRQEDRAKALASGATAYLAKPVSPAELLSTTQRALVPEDG